MKAINKDPIDKVTLLVPTCDAFHDIWRASMLLIQDYWPIKTPSRLVYVSDTSTVPHGYVECRFIEVGEGRQYSDRLLEALDSVKTEYVVLLLDDYFLYKEIPSDALRNLVSIADEHAADYIHFDHSYKVKESGLAEGEDKLYINSKFRVYSVNMTPGFWRTSSLKRAIRPQSNAWEMEVNLASICQANGMNCFYYDDNVIPYIDGIRKGKLMRRARRFLLKRGLYDGNRPLAPLFTKQNVGSVIIRLVPERVLVWLQSLRRKLGSEAYRDKVDR